MGGGVARLADVLEALPKVPVHDGPEVLSVHEAGQPVIVGHDQPTVHGVHPFDGKLHTPAAVEHAGCRVDSIDSFRRNGNLSECGELGVREEKIKVGHGITSILFLLFFLCCFIRNLYEQCLQFHNSIERILHCVFVNNTILTVSRAVSKLVSSYF